MKLVVGDLPGYFDFASLKDLSCFFLILLFYDYMCDFDALTRCLKFLPSFSNKLHHSLNFLISLHHLVCQQKLLAEMVAVRCCHETICSTLLAVVKFLKGM